MSSDRATTLTSDAGRTDPEKRRRLLEFLTANGLDPNRIPVDAMVIIERDTVPPQTIRTEYFLLDEEGNPVYVDGEFLREQVAFPLLTP